MVVTFTLNPAVDRTLFVSKLKPNGVNRVLSAHFDAGGHGINVCRGLKVMGTESIACGFIGGQNGRMIKDFLSAASIPYDFIEIPGETRVNIKIVEEDGSHTDFNDVGFTISDSDYERLRDRMGPYIGHDNIIALCEITQRPPEILLTCAGLICDCGVKEIDAELQPALDDFTGMRLIKRPGMLPVLGISEAHASHADS